MQGLGVTEELGLASSEIEARCTLLAAQRPLAAPPRLCCSRVCSSYVQRPLCEDPRARGGFACGQASKVRPQHVSREGEQELSGFRLGCALFHPRPP